MHSVQQQSIIMISLILTQDIASEKMYSNQTQLMNIFIINCVLLHTEEHLNSCSYFVKIITLKESIL
jgi:phosphopantetheinyl transferase